MNLVNRYIARRIVRGIVTAFLIVTAVIMLVDFVEATRNIGEDGDLSLLTIAGLTALKAPQLIEQTVPFVVLFGVMGALYGLNKRSELIVLRASGLSAWRFLRPALWVSGILGVIWALALNPLAARSMDSYRSILAQKTAPDLNTAPSRDIWLREGGALGQIVIHGTLNTTPNLGTATRPTQAQLDDVTFYYYDFKTRDTEIDARETSRPTEFTRRVDASRATLLPSGYWHLETLVENADGAPFSKHAFASFPTTLTPDDVLARRKKDMSPPFWQLPGEIARMERAGFSTVGLQMQWHKLLALPLSLIAMTIIAAGVSMHLTRGGGTLRLMLAGGAIGFGVYFVNNLMSAFGEAQTLPVLMAAWFVPVIVLAFGTAFLAKIEDG